MFARRPENPGQRNHLTVRRSAKKSRSSSLTTVRASTSVRTKAVAQGRIKADDKPSDEQLIACIFEPGFTTASKVTQVSGRGIGMDVVRSEIEELGGRVEVSTRTKKGTTFTLYLPLTLAVAQTVLVRAGGRLWALPADGGEVEQMKRALVNTMCSDASNGRG
jgi:chemosensory pili system protein ChpA (sensor histidine kinase/response regulator)